MVGPGRAKEQLLISSLLLAGSILPHHHHHHNHHRRKALPSSCLAAIGRPWREKAKNRRMVNGRAEGKVILKRYHGPVRASSSNLVSRCSPAAASERVDDETLVTS